jgi:hypothetical protein
MFPPKPPRTPPGDPFDEWYPSSGGDVVKLDPTEVLARFYDPTIGRMGLLAT